MALPEAVVFALQHMRAVLGRQRFIRRQPGNDRVQFRKWKPALLAELEVLLELRGEGRRKDHEWRASNMLSTSLKPLCTLPAFASAKALRVVALGRRISNGSPFWRMTCL